MVDAPNSQQEYIDTLSALDRQILEARRLSHQAMPGVSWRGCILWKRDAGRIGSRGWWGASKKRVREVAAT